MPEPAASPIPIDNPRQRGVWSFALGRAWSTLRHRYAESGLGVLWNITGPLLTIALFSLAFGLLLDRGRAGIDVPFPIWLCVGLLPFEAFRESVAKGITAMRRNAGYLKKLPIPEHVFVLETALVALGNALISMGVLAIVVGVWELTRAGGGPAVLSWWWALAPLPIGTLMVSGYGIGLALGTLRVFIPDIEQASQPIQRVLFWTSPTIIPMALFAEARLGWLPLSNPAGAPIVALRAMLIDHEPPRTLVVVLSLAFAALCAAIGWAVHARLRAEIRDLL